METEQSDSDDSAGIGTDTAVPARKASPRPPQTDRSRRSVLVSTLEGEIVPRLLMLHRAAGPAKLSIDVPSATTGASEVEELARALLAQSPETAHEFVEAVHQRGVPYDRICLGLLIPAAHFLAERWERRELGFQELMLGLGVLQAVVLGIGGAADRNRCASRRDPPSTSFTMAKRCQ
jgi:MerR family transcriptional regulator, light-induced transcriptional regulator